jgi:hypothetical protein
MEVDHGDDSQDGGADETPVGHHDGQVDPGRDHVRRVLADRQAGIERSGFDRARRRPRPPAPPGVGPRHHQGHVVAGVDQGVEGEDGDLGGAEKGEAQGGQAPSLPASCRMATSS